MVLGILSTTRDILIIAWAFLSVVALVLIIFAAWTIYRGVMGLINTAKATVDDDVKPILSIAQDSATNVTGTARFMSDAVARPVIRGLSVLAGARRAISVFTGMTGRGRHG